MLTYGRTSAGDTPHKPSSHDEIVQALFETRGFRHIEILANEAWSRIVATSVAL